ncbi:heparan sulfate glucosamine 3-O-sulfotransferase 1-like [Neocloeon triangulifer]|uniref:heparan sulfate glucosamine 3-O-sulfotransferase 1-like n=1 Tax=Neocloeon triangulifer TaxID=2078957 RepID=UPI00286EF71D|nr:heparan sulfate glucosamine 3-O-sulfotransferase 1-like [Neocloeon triangulifer]
MESKSGKEDVGSSLWFPEKKPKFPRLLCLLIVTCVLLLVSLLVLYDHERCAKRRELIPRYDPWNGNASEIAQAKSRNNKELSPDENSASHLQRNLPQVVAIGVRDGGYELLLKLLGEHPSIKTVNQSTGFFESDSKFARGLDWYEAQMPQLSQGQVLVEVSPDAFSRHKILERVHLMSPNSKLLIVLRDPLERVLLRVPENLPRHPVARQKEIKKIVDGVEVGKYSRNLKNAMQIFPKEKIHVVPFEKLIKSPVEELKKVCRFMGVDDSIYNDKVEEEIYQKVSDSYEKDKKVVETFRRRCVPRCFKRIQIESRKTYNHLIHELSLLTGDEFFKTWLY